VTEKDSFQPVLLNGKLSFQRTTLALSHMHDMTLTVKTAMALSSIASSATIQRKIDVLCKFGLIDKVFDDKNRRTKYLVPTAVANQYFSSLGDAMKQSLMPGKVTDEDVIVR
jgi:DNA-binding MarR family transcriptional regulator